MRNPAKIYVVALFVIAFAASCGGGGGGGGTVNTNPTYAITYDGNANTGGSVPIDLAKYEQGQTVTVLGNTGSLVRSGYTFTGWDAQANGGGTSYTQGQTFLMGSANVTLYAKWSAQAQSTTIPTQYANTLAISSLNPTYANSVYRNGINWNGLSVGCFWAYNSYQGIQDFNCYWSLVRFDISPVSGKTIDSAILKLTAWTVPAQTTRADWYFQALSTDWNPTTVTSNNYDYSYYTGSQINQSRPSYAGQIYEIDVTNTVRNWSSGAWDNHGLIFGPQNVLFPYISEVDNFEFYSVGDSGQRWPVLVISYH